MPSHQIRVQQNNCDHFIATLESELGVFQLCLKCGKRKDTPKDSTLKDQIQFDVSETDHQE
jgi:hypothetical protein